MNSYEHHHDQHRPEPNPLDDPFFDVKRNVGNYSEALPKRARAQAWITIGIVIIMILLALFSCQDRPTSFSVQPELQKYYDYFRAEALKRNKAFPEDNAIISINKGALDKWGGIGVSRRNVHGQWFLMLDEDWFVNAPEWQRERVFFHECGHTFLGRGHTSLYSLMNVDRSGMPWEMCGSDHGPAECDRAPIINELFGLPSW